MLFTEVRMGTLNISVVIPAIPAIGYIYFVGKQLLSLIFSIYVLANLAYVSLIAKLSDLFGRSKIYMIALTGIFLKSRNRELETISGSCE